MTAVLEAGRAAVPAPPTGWINVLNEGDPNKVFEAATANLYSDLEMSVGVTVNSGRESWNDGALPLRVPGAAPEQPQSISVRITAHKERIPAVVAATNFAALAALPAR
jgi:hypothetical protein